MAASPNRPGVEVEQVLSESATVSASPTLVPLIAGPCFQIVEALDSDGELEADAVYAGAQYNQADMLIPQADFPDPRGNIDEINITEDSVGAYLYFGGSLLQLVAASRC